VACHLCIRSITAKARQAGNDKAGVECEDSLGTEIERLENARAEGFDEHISILEERFKDLKALQGFEVEGD